MDDRAIWAIREYIHDSLPNPAKSRSKRFFKEQSYSRWAANEILSQIIKNEHIPPVTVVENLLRKADNVCSSERTDKSIRLMFSVVRNVAEDITEILRAME